MAPKRKGFMVVGPSASGVPVATQTGDGMDVGGGGEGLEPPRHSGDQSQASGVVRSGDGNPRATRSKDEVVLPTGGVVNSKDGRAPSKTPTPAHAPRPSQVTRDEQRRDVGGSKRPHGKTPEHLSRDARDQHACQNAGGSGVRSWDRDGAVGNMP